MAKRKQQNAIVEAPGPYDLGGGVLIDHEIIFEIPLDFIRQLFWERLRDDGRDEIKRKKGGESTAALHRQKSRDDQKAFLALRDKNPGLKKTDAARRFLQKTDPRWSDYTPEHH